MVTYAPRDDEGMGNFGSLHHVELQVSDFETSIGYWTWLFEALGYAPYQQWSGGHSWRHGSTYIVLGDAPQDGPTIAGFPALTTSPSTPGPGRTWTVGGKRHQRMVGISSMSIGYPWAGGDEHYAAFLENFERFTVELVAADPVH